MFKNWKTSLSGVFLAGLGVMSVVQDPTLLLQKDITKNPIAQIVSGVGLIVAKDHDSPKTEAPKA